MGAPSFDDHIRETARLLAVLHGAQPPVRGPAASGATLDALRANWEDSFAVLEPLVGPVIAQEEFDRSQRLVEEYLAGRGPLFQERIDQGWVRDGHGDLRAEHVFCLDDGPRLIDCLAFRDDLRIGDVLLDIAFLAMDLHRLAGPTAAWALIHHYDEFSAERHPSSLAHHYAAYRANVRAKVAAVRFGQGVDEAASEAAAYHDLAHQHLLIGRTRLVLVGGGAGVGKSTVAAGVADSLGAIWLRADEIRKNMAGIPTEQHAWAEPDQGIYRPEFSDRVYREMLREAELLLVRGESVVLDATWASAEHRCLARDLAERTSAALTELECRAPLALARERIVRRLAAIGQPSDATPEVAAHIAASFEPWAEATVVDTSTQVQTSVATACHLVLDDPSLGPDGDG
ncbi:MAG: AAA family ATPase, partial [Actinomycetota bacterium]